jgi:hypothetical protein
MANLKALGLLLHRFLDRGDLLGDRAQGEALGRLDAVQLDAELGLQRALGGWGRLDLPGEGGRLAGLDHGGLAAVRRDLVALALQVGVGAGLFGRLGQAQLGGFRLDQVAQGGGQGQGDLALLALGQASAVARVAPLVASGATAACSFCSLVSGLASAAGAVEATGAMARRPAPGRGHGGLAAVIGFSGAGAGATATGLGAGLATGTGLVAGWRPVAGDGGPEQ